MSRSPSPVATASLALASLALATSNALADPVALRSPSASRSIDVVAGASDGSVAFWWNRSLGFAVDTHAFATLGFHVGTQVTLAGRPTGFALDLHASAGISMLRHQLGVAGNATLSLRMRNRWEHVYLALGLVSNTSFGGSLDFQVRVPLRAEFWLTFRHGFFSWGLQSGAGMAFVPPFSPSLDLQISGFLGFALPEPAARK